MKSLLAKYSNILKKDCCYSWSILIVRLVAGVAMMLHGWGKIQNPLSWMGPDAPVPGIFQALAALSEFGGGLAWVLGLFTPLASLGLFFTMAVAALTHITRGDAFVGTPPTYELALVYLTVSLHLLLSGPGKFSADYKLFSR
ncbi:DoxX family protein [Bdellovibrio sp. HCB337]|uniref:DoxX family protein n=1 Tax=Bdellovibrio sp. HCB337 TaxID=3394358 RepID=UPI0039A61667